MPEKDGKAEPLRHPLPMVEFQEMHVVYVRGVVNRSYFGLGPKNRMPASVLLTESAAHLAFSSLSLHSWVGDPSDGVGVYKLFSRCVAGRRWAYSFVSSRCPRLV